MTRNHNKGEFYFHIFIIVILARISYVKCDNCLVSALCSCEVNNTSPEHVQQNGNNTPPPLLNSPLLGSDFLQSSNLNICGNVTTNHTNTQFILNCTSANFTKLTEENEEAFNFKISALDNQSVKIFLKYSCPSEPVHHGYSTGTILIIIFLTCVFGYLGLGVTVKYFLLGARGWELLPHVDFWKDFPSLIRDGAKFLQNGCKARPSDLNPTNPDSYDAI